MPRKQRGRTPVAVASPSTFTPTGGIAKYTRPPPQSYADPREKPDPSKAEAPLFYAITTLISFIYMGLFGVLWDTFSIYLSGKESALYNHGPGYAPILSNDETFFVRRMFFKAGDNYGRPVQSCPGTYIHVCKMEFDTHQLKQIVHDQSLYCMNTGSYNYLGYAQNKGYCADQVEKGINHYGLSMCSPRVELGTCLPHISLENKVAEFLGKEAALCYGMGFATNSTTIPALVGGPESLIISDSMNHSSLIVGIRNSGACVKVFQHNNMGQLEKRIQEGILYGHPRTRRPFTRILIIVEGIYSMEGDICPLPQIVALKKKYKCYLYIDEAHSIGALGPTGRGASEYHGIDPKDVDLFMGTFTKSFGSTGGYIAADKAIIDYLRYSSYGSITACAMSPCAAIQTFSVFQAITGENGSNDGKRRIAQLSDSTLYFRNKLKEMGLPVIGQNASPVVPVLMYEPGRLIAFARICLERGLAVVPVGPPAAEYLGLRVRFCLSAGHTRADINFALQTIWRVARFCRMGTAKMPELEGEILKVNPQDGRMAHEFFK